MKKESFIMLDADGGALKESLEYLPSAIKPNRHELSRLVGRELRTELEIVEACKGLHEKAIPHVLVSRGKDGLILSTKGKTLKAVAPPVDVESTVGAGDATVAGFVLAHSQGKPLDECVRLACAAGAATARTPGTELCHKDDVQSLIKYVDISVI